MAASAAIQAVYEIGDVNSLPLAAATTIYQGSAVGQISGTDTYRPLEPADKFAGFAIDTFVKSTDVTKVQVKTEGMIVLTIDTLDDTAALGATVYAIDDNTFTLAADDGVVTVTYSAVGKIHRLIGPGYTQAVVTFNANRI
jgi:hypothetical protein